MKGRGRDARRDGQRAIAAGLPLALSGHPPVWGCEQEETACWPVSPTSIYWLSSEPAIELYSARAGGALINHQLTPYFTGVSTYTERLSDCIRSSSRAKVRIQIPCQLVHNASVPPSPYRQGEGDRLVYMSIKRRDGRTFALNALN